MSSTQRFGAIALCLCLAMLAVSPSMSLGVGHRAIPDKAKKCKKGYVRKGGKCRKKPKKPASNVPADGSYAADNGIAVSLATTSGKRNVAVRASIPLTCSPSGSTESVAFLVRNMPLTGTTFTGKSPPDPEFGQTTMSGNFLSAKSLHLTAQVADYKNGSDTCTGQLDVTFAIHSSP